MGVVVFIVDENKVSFTFADVLPPSLPLSLVHRRSVAPRRQMGGGVKEVVKAPH